MPSDLSRLLTRYADALICPNFRIYMCHCVYAVRYLQFGGMRTISIGHSRRKRRRSTFRERPTCLNRTFNVPRTSLPKHRGAHPSPSTLAPTCLRQSPLARSLLAHSLRRAFPSSSCISVSMVLYTRLSREAIEASIDFYVALDGSIDANLSITANVMGPVSSGSIPLFQVGIPGLTFPG